MKTSLLFSLFAFLWSVGFGQAGAEIVIPAPVSSAFSTKFPAATQVKWEKENATEYEAEFRMGGVQMSSNFAADGKWLETETEISFAQLPPAVSSSFSKNHKNAGKAEAAKIELASGKIIYEIEVAAEPKGSKGSKEEKGSKGSKAENGSHEREFFYDETGKELKGSK